MTLTLSVQNMHCEACARRVTTVVQKKHPGAQVKVDLAADTVSIEGGVDAQAVVAALEDAGYPVKAIHEAR